MKNNCVVEPVFYHCQAIAIECNTNVNRVSVEEVEALMTKCAALMLKQFEALTDEQFKVLNLYFSNREKFDLDIQSCLR